MASAVFLLSEGGLSCLIDKESILRGFFLVALSCAAIKA